MDGNQLSISPQNLYALVGTAAAPAVIDVRHSEAVTAAGRVIAGATHRVADNVEQWRDDFPSDQRIIVYCQHGRELSQSAARMLRAVGFDATHVEGGIDAWQACILPTRRILGSDVGRWATRQRPKIDRIVCPWLNLRFIDPRAAFLYVPASEVIAVAEHTGAIPFDIEGVQFAHEGERCSFDTILRIFDIQEPALDRLATIVRGADTSRHDLAPNARACLPSRSACRRTSPMTTKCCGTVSRFMTHSTHGVAAWRPRPNIGQPSSARDETIRVGIVCHRPAFGPVKARSAARHGVPFCTACLATNSSGSGVGKKPGNSAPYRRTKMSHRIERRDFIQGVGIVAGAAAAAALAQSASAQNAPQAGAKAMTYEPKPLPLDPKAIKGISEKVLVSHYENNYVGAVKRLTAISAQLADLDFAKAPTFMINGLKREELIAANSMILHEVYFDSLGGGGTPVGGLADAIARDFGSVDRWRTEFSAMGKAEGGGSGWVLLAYSPRDKRLVNQWAADHTTTLAGGRPVLALDMYEHAYHMDYGAAAARYVDVFMEAIRWDNAVKLYDRYSRET